VLMRSRHRPTDQWACASIPVENGQSGREIVVRFETPLQSASRFYTDSKGLEFMERTRNHRPTWEVNITDSVAGNYYPMNAAAYLRDADMQFSVLTDRSQGAHLFTSLHTPPA
jgi:hypothetical protein